MTADFFKGDRQLTMDGGQCHKKKKRCKKGTSFPSTIGDRTDDSSSDRTGLGMDRTCDMISERPETGPAAGMVKGLVKGLAPVLMSGLVTRTGNRTSERTRERTSASIDDRTGDRDW
jgi:hypothetical protein